jgi:DNA repair exonuclease SbcCD nuclease subunit
LSVTDFRFVHAADLHLDTPFSGLARLSPEMAGVLREASLEAFDGLVELCLRADAAFLLLAGDIHDGAERGVRAQLRVRRGFERLSRHGIRVFVVHGNHDPIGGWSAVRDWPEGVTVFGAGEVSSVPVERGGRQLALVHGISYGRRHETENLALRFGRTGGPGLQIGLLHCHAGSDPSHAPYSPCRVEDLVTAGLDYWALGHLHRHRVLREGDPWVCYPGCLQGRSLSPTETGPKGALVAEVRGGSVSSVRFEPLDRVRFLSETLAIDHIDDDLVRLTEALQQRAEVLRREHEGRPLVLRMTLEGRGPLHGRLGMSGVIDDLVEALRQSEPPGHSSVWWEGIRDRTGASRDLDAMAGQEDFAAWLIRLQRRLGDDPSALRQFVREKSTAPALRGLARRMSAPDDDQASLLLERALDQALDLLEDER